MYQSEKLLQKLLEPNQSWNINSVSSLIHQNCLQFIILDLPSQCLCNNNGIRTHNHLVCKRTLTASFAKCLSVHLRTKWLWVGILLLSLKLQIWSLLRARSSLTFRQTIECKLKLVRDMITTYSPMSLDSLPLLTSSSNPWRDKNTQYACKEEASRVGVAFVGLRPHFDLANISKILTLCSVVRFWFGLSS